MKKALSILFLFAFIFTHSVNSQEIPKEPHLTADEFGIVCTSIQGVESGYNDQEVTVTFTLLNTTPNYYYGLFQMYFWEGIIWWMECEAYSTFLAPNEPRTFTFTGRIPSGSYIKRKDVSYSLRIFTTPFSDRANGYRYIRGAKVPFRLL